MFFVFSIPVGQFSNDYRSNFTDRNVDKTIQFQSKQFELSDAPVTEVHASVSLVVKSEKDPRSDSSADLLFSAPKPKYEFSQNFLLQSNIELFFFN